MPLILNETIFKIDTLHKNDWSELSAHFSKDYMQKINDFLAAQQAQKIAVYPPANLIFKALELTPLSKVKVVILGQDPYHKKGQANGLSFSVAKGVKIPPSLRNILLEVGIKNPKNGDLTNWAKQGVLLLNSILTVEHGKAGAHHHLGWQNFTDAIIKLVNDKRSNVVFMLWGKFAHSKISLIDQNKHLVLTAAHPSSLSAYRGFLGCKHFALANEYLITNKINPINWHNLDG